MTSPHFTPFHLALISNLQTHAKQSRHASAYIMAANASVIKAIVSFHRVNWDTVFERHRRRYSRIVHALKKQERLNMALDISIS